MIFISFESQYATSY